ncbi:MAG: hypothetical protein VKJ64_19170 [Leptolyngbyaceae bacterium]|nr:hypothetical protein [Leptolyngbyaceae bacterium]
MRGLDVRIPEEAVVPDAKVTHYLLVPKARNDKAKYLAQAGFTQDFPNELKVALQKQVTSNEAIEDRSNEYGTFYQVLGDLVGPNETRLPVVTIWLRRRIDGKFQFVTLKPQKDA